jgi:hypothetical protein
MRHMLRWYGANPLHLLALLGCFAVAGYAAARLVPSNPWGIGIWFMGAVVLHDLLLFPLYSLADWSATAVIRHRAPSLPSIAWINYLRVPTGLSALLLLVWSPLILRFRTRYQASTTLSPNPYLSHWLAVSGALFLLSAAAFALRLRAARTRGVPDLGTPDPGVPAASVPDTGVPDLGIPDPGMPDTGVPDTGVPDPGVPAVGVAEPELPRPVPPPPRAEHDGGQPAHPEGDQPEGNGR